MGKVIQVVLAYAVAVTAGLSLIWDMWDLLKQAGKCSVSEYIRSSWMAIPAGLAIGMLVMSHFIRWPWR